MTQFKKIDLHIHTPWSRCYEDHLVPEAHLHTTPQDIVKAAMAAGLDAIAITDHNTAEGIDSVREVVEHNGLCIFPGMELTTRGGHVLAIFEPNTPVRTLRQLLKELGFKEEQGGDGFFQAEHWMDEVFQKIDRYGGLAIAAHVDRQPRGFIASVESREDKKRIHNSSYLSALEITAPQDKPLWNHGEMPHFPKRYPCLQGSDAHAPGEISRRPTFLGISRLDLAGLQLAFQEYEDRIRFPYELDEGWAS